ncbi:MAG: hypothetical protein AAF569_02395 [Pseudomonadota bacterium]
MTIDRRKVFAGLAALLTVGPSVGFSQTVSTYRYDYSDIAREIAKSTPEDIRNSPHLIASLKSCSDFDQLKMEIDNIINDDLESADIALDQIASEYDADIFINRIQNPVIKNTVLGLIEDFLESHNLDDLSANRGDSLQAAAAHVLGEYSSLLDEVRNDNCELIAHTSILRSSRAFKV